MSTAPPALKMQAIAQAVPQTFLGTIMPVTNLVQQILFKPQVTSTAAIVTSIVTFVLVLRLFVLSVKQPDLTYPISTTPPMQLGAVWGDVPQGFTPLLGEESISVLPAMFSVLNVREIPLLVSSARPGITFTVMYVSKLALRASSPLTQRVAVSVWTAMWSARTWL